MLLLSVIRAKERVKYISVQNPLISSRVTIDLSIYNIDIVITIIYSYYITAYILYRYTYMNIFYIFVYVSV